MVTQAIIPLAGLGTRLLPLSSVIPKELLPINGKPNLEYILEECIQSGISEVIFIISKRKKAINKSLLDQIEGIGSMRKRALLNHFGSARAVESASLDEIKSVEGVEEKVAKKIYNFFHE